MSKAMNSAPAPDSTGAPGIADNTPLLEMENAETVPEPVFVTKANPVVCPEGVFILLPQLFKSSAPARAAVKDQKRKHAFLAVGDMGRRTFAKWFDFRL